MFNLKKKKKQQQNKTSPIETDTPKNSLYLLSQDCVGVLWSTHTYT